MKKLARIRITKNNIKQKLIFVIAFLFGVIVALQVGYATIRINSNVVKYNNSVSTGITASNVQGAIDQLKTKATNTTNTSALATAVFNSVYPVGSIYMTTTSYADSSAVNSALGGGTWEVFGTGRTLVGYDSTQTEFDTVEETGGDKRLQAHKHTWYARWKYRNVVTSSGLGTQTNGKGLSNATIGTGPSSPDFNFSGAYYKKNNSGNRINISGKTATTNLMSDENGNFVPTESVAEGSGNLQPYIVVYMWRRTA